MRLSYVLAASILGFAACATDDTHTDELPFEGDASDAGKADDATVAVTPIDADVSFDRREAGGAYVITTKAAWKRVMGTAAPADVDFSKEWVAFYGTGLQNTGGYSAEVTGLAYSASLRSLIVSTHATSPGPDCVVTQALTTPHQVVKFAIPSPRPLFALADASSEVRRCSPSNAERLVELAESRAEWERVKTSHEGSYTYKRTFASWTGFSGETTIVVANGVVTERHYKAQHTSGGEATIWSEYGAEVGSHTDEGFAPVLLDALYDECRTSVLTQDEDTNWMQFSLDERGLLQACTYTPMACQDDCTRGPVISELLLYLQ